MTNKPIFAVVGHPNKGKSSIVSTLSQDDKIAISPISGTTEKAQQITIGTGNTAYILVDTPGFQRPSRVLNWLQQHCGNASERASTIKQFTNDSACKAQFPDEVALLQPIVAGAAILYVVDGSRPYGSEYEAEMEILRWTGKPSMALINPIENSDYIEEWHAALAQYFKSVRVFNPMSADFTKQSDLLKTFAYLNPQWSAPLHNIVTTLNTNREQQRQQSIHILEQLVTDLCHYQCCQKTLSETSAKVLKPALMQQYTNWMSKREQAAIDELLNVFRHHSLHVELDTLNLPPDLFDCDQWFAWGLNKKQLTYAAAATGALGGAAVDVALVGQSLMLGAISGGIIGAGSAWFGANKIVDLRIKNLPVGGYQACVGPIKNRNFPYVVIARFVFLFKQIAQRNHANRQAMRYQASDFQQSIEQFQKHQQKHFHSVCDKLIKQQPIENLANTLEPLFTLDSE